MSNGENQAPSLGAAARRFDLNNRVVVVTRAPKGIGRELTILLAETGAVVVPTVRTDADAVAVTAEAQSRGLTVHPQLLDVRDVTSINEAVSRIFAAHGCIDVLVNNASLGFARAAFDVTEADWDEMMAVNLRGAFFMSQAAARTMAGSGRGSHRQHQFAGRPCRSARRGRVLRQQGPLEHDDEDPRARMGEGRNYGQRGRADVHLYARDGVDPR